MNLSFEEFYRNAKMIVEKTTPGTKNSKLSATDANIVNAIASHSNKNLVSEFCIKIPNGITSKNSAQKAFTDLIENLCAEENNFSKLKKLLWLHPSEDVNDFSRFGLVREGYYVHKDENVTLLMVRSVRAVLDLFGEDALKDYSFQYELREDVGEWFPSLEKYNPDISKEKWLELLNDSSTFTQNAYVSIARMYELGGIASCQQLANKYGDTAHFYNGALGVQLPSKVRVKLEIPYYVNEEGKSQVWPIMFQGRSAGSEEEGTFVWKMRPELYDALTEFNISRFLSENKGGGGVSGPIVTEIKWSKYKPIDNTLAHNKIVFGAPGTGKSFKLNQYVDGNEENIFGPNYERVTFHPDYTYANFVGAYKPVSTESNGNILDNDTKTVIGVLTDENKSAQEKYDALFEKFKAEGLTRLPILLGIATDDRFETKKADGSPAVNNNDVERNHGRALRKYVNFAVEESRKSDISYEYVPGPFMTTFVKAVKSLLSDTPERFLLIIEEINRANMAAVFGDIFQLLDRNAEHVSEYSITTTQDMRKYLMKELNCTEDAVKEIKIPSNMYIWATMNSADQGVFPMDTAFKRRWNFEYLDIDEGEDGMKHYAFDITVGKEIHTVNWNELRHKINDKLTDMGVNEDKLLGPYFIAKSVMEGDNDGFIDAFKNKVLMYLYEDAAKHKRDRIFATDVSGNQNKRYSQILKNFDNYGLNIFAGNSFDDAVVENKPIGSADGIEA